MLSLIPLAIALIGLASALGQEAVGAAAGRIVPQLTPGQRGRTGRSLGTHDDRGARAFDWACVSCSRRCRIGGPATGGPLTYSWTRSAAELVQTAIS